ncbi:MAG: hypothetical protein BGN88_11560 [Clostridiales bacterium 43-6]|nr:MAG: hypothetical protein BGN88_11560 [Clostridiales bacterium 43-6]
MTIHIPAKELPVAYTADICVLGGSCTGVFAAVRAARLGARVAIIEKQNAFGGVATSGMVGIWHSLMDSEYQTQIIGGLTAETVDRLAKRNAVETVEHNPSRGFVLNTEELKIELDELISENNIKAFLHTAFCEPFTEDGKLKGVIVENKSGRSAVLASYFIDATGDADLCRRLDVPMYQSSILQPPSPCAKFYGVNGTNGLDLPELIYRHHKEFNLPEDWGWRCHIPGMPPLSFHAETHVFHVDCSKGDDLTYAEMEGRRQIRAVMDIVRKYAAGKADIRLAGLQSYLGIRETLHITSKYRLTNEDVLYGKRFPDAIANGAYRVDIHQADRPGIVFQYLDGTEVYHRVGYPDEYSRWRIDDGPYPTFYQVPFSSLLPVTSYSNLVTAGRMVDTEEGAFGAVRVMVNTNQMGEAAGVAACLALQQNCSISEVPSLLLRRTLKDGGSIL